MMRSTIVTLRRMQSLVGRLTVSHLQMLSCTDIIWYLHYQMNSLPEPLPYRKHLFHLVATSKFHQETPSFSRRWFFGALKYCLLSSVIVALLDPSHGRIQRTIGLVLFLGAEGFWRIFQVWLHFDWSPPHFINNIYIYIILYNIILYYYIIYIIYMLCNHYCSSGHPFLLLTPHPWKCS